MIPTRKLIAALAGAVLLAQAPSLLSQESAAANIRVLCVAEAVVEIDGVKTGQTGAIRRFVTPALTPGKKFFYILKATWKEGGKDQSKEEKVAVEAGKETTVDLRPTAVVEPIKVDPKKEDKKDPITKKEEKKDPVVVKKKPDLDVPFAATPQEIVEEMLKLAGVTKDDVVYDLGCGDGRIVVTAAKQYGAKGVGIDLDPVRVVESNANVKAAKVEKLVEIREGDALKVPDLSKASVVTLYMLPAVNLKLRPQLLKELKPGSRVVSHNFDMGDWQADKHIQVKDKEGVNHNLFLWNVGVTKKDPIVKKEEKKDPKFDDPKYIFVPTPDDVVEKMLQVAKVTKDDVVYDLGCGNGIIVATAAAKYGCKAVGVDINPVRVKESNEMVKKMKVEKLVEIREGDVFKVKDLDKASVLCLYLLPDLLKELEPKFKKELKPGTRIISHDFLIGEWKPEQEISFDSNSGRAHMIYVWTIPDPSKTVKVPDRKPDIHYVPTPQPVVDKMLEAAKVGKGDVVYDLGCGDGRIVVTAAKKFGAKGVGYDIDPERVKDSNKNVKDSQVEKLVTIKHADIFEEDLAGASVVTLYLLPKLNVKLVPQLQKLKPGTRIVSHDFDIKGYKPKDTIRITAKDDQGNEDVHMIYLFTIPLEKE